MVNVRCAVNAKSIVVKYEWSVRWHTVSTNGSHGVWNYLDSFTNTWRTERQARQRYREMITHHPNYNIELIQRPITMFTVVETTKCTTCSDEQLMDVDREHDF